MWSPAVLILWSTFSSINRCSVSLCCCNQDVLDLHYDALYLCKWLCVCVCFLPGPLEDRRYGGSLLQVREGSDVWLNIAVIWGRTASGCSSSLPTYPRQKLILFAELFGKAWVSVWVCSIWCLTCCAFHFSLLCHLNSSLFCDFVLKKDWYFWRLVKWHRSACFQDTGFNVV